MKKYSSYQKLFRATLATTVVTGALVAAVPDFTMTAEAKSTSFLCVKEGHYFYEGVMNLTARGVINGYTKRKSGLSYIYSENIVPYCSISSVIQSKRVYIQLPHNTCGLHQ